MTSNLNIPLQRTDCPLYLHTGQPVALSYERIVIGERGPYVEFLREDFHPGCKPTIPADQKYRCKEPWLSRVYYLEYRWHGVMIYKQMKTVSYADYRVGRLYISPWDLSKKNGDCIIDGFKPAHHH